MIARIDKKQRLQIPDVGGLDAIQRSASSLSTFFVVVGRLSEQCKNKSLVVHSHKMSNDGRPVSVYSRLLSGVPGDHVKKDQKKNQKSQSKSKVDTGREETKTQAYS